MNEDLATPLVFDSLDLIEVPVTIAGKNYKLREASGDAAIKFQNAVTRCSKFVDGKFSGIQGNLADSQPLLISMCLFGEDGKLVPEATIRRWPNRVQKALYDKVREISQLEEKEDKAALQKQLADIQKKLADLGEDPEKNCGEPTTDGSDLPTS